MLNSRQKNIIKDLEHATTFLTARGMADKYSVSLRTIRSDINEIVRFAKEQKIEFLRVPGQGMRIISDKPVSASLDQTLRNDHFVYADSRQRSILLFLNILFTDGPVSINDLCRRFDVSKSMILSTVRYTQEILNKQNLSISHYQNKGYLLSGALRNFVCYCEELCQEQGEELIYNTLIEKDNRLISEDDLRKIEHTLRFIHNDLSLYITHHLLLAFVLYCVIHLAKENKRSSSNHLLLNEDKLLKLVTYLQDLFSVRFNKDSVKILKFILNSTTDYSANFSDGISDDLLPKAIDSMIDYVDQSGMYQVNDPDVLRFDLLIHLRSTSDAIASGMSRDNPLLHEIRSSYPNEFNLIKSAAQKFQEVYPLKLDDNEIGYLVLYFLRSFDKVEKIQATNVMVVCNTGRSASKLLATRLINNIPDIHIVSMNSIYNISNDPEALQNVDFIISTIPLRNVSKPHVVISPLLQKNEIAKVREAIWLSKSEIQFNDDIGNVASSMLEEQKKNHTEPNTNTNNQYYDAQNIIPNNVVALLGEVSMNLFYLISDLYPKGIPASALSNLSGIYAHVLMSIPRWQRKEFIKPWDDEELIKENRPQYEAIRNYLHQESERLGIAIPDSEIMAILRYYVY